MIFRKHKIADSLLYGIQVMAIVLLLFINSGKISAQASNTNYKEYVNVHLGRSTYIAGEIMVLQSYCFSNLSEPSEFLSKALYIELIDINQSNILSQVLQIENNTASAVVQIPDTLISGTYMLKAYTNWMKNFGDNYFYSQPIYIYNQYNSNAEMKPGTEQVVISPQVYIQGATLIRGIPSKVKICLPGNKRICFEGAIVERYSGKQISKFFTDANGEAVVSFTPQPNLEYSFSVGDSVNGYRTYPLPDIQFSGYALSIDSISGQEFFVRIYASNLPKEKLLLKVSSNGRQVLELPVTHLENSLEVHIPESASGIIDFKVYDERGEILSSQTVVALDTKDVENMIYPTGSKVSMELDLSALSASETSSFSVSVHKKEGRNENFSSGSYSFISLDKNKFLVMPRYWQTNSAYDAERGIMESDYLIEDLGMLFTGTIENPVNNSPLSDVDVVVAMKDTIGLILAGKTNDKGHFSILLNDKRNKEAYISIYKKDIPVSGNHRIYLDQQFYYKALNSGTQMYFEHSTDTGFYENITDEAQRVLIQKAFSNLWLSKDSLSGCFDLLGERFYGQPLLTVYPDDFFYLPNFEEIAREILPRVRYKHNNNECELIVSHIEDNTRSSVPIALVDGNLIGNHCDLYDLDSDDIQRIEVQSGLRASGNLLYNGLVAIYTTEKYKEENERRNGRQTYPVPGYMNSQTILSYDRGEGGMENPGAPDFKNQLYWNPAISLDDKGKAKIEFFASDEEGDFIVEIVGYTLKGIPVYLQKKIRVYAD